MRILLLLSAAAITVPTSTLSQTACVNGSIAGIPGECSGAVGIISRTDNPTEGGDTLFVAPFDNQAGVYTIRAGDTLLLQGSPTNVGRESRPGINVGDGQNADGTVDILGGTIELVNDRGSPSIFSGDDGGTGGFNIRDGGLLRMDGYGPLERDTSIGERGTTFFVGFEGGVLGTLDMNNGRIEMRSSIASRLIIGEFDARGEANIDNGSSILLSQEDISGGTPSDTIFRVGQLGSSGTLSMDASSVEVRTQSGNNRFEIGSDPGSVGTATFLNGSNVVLSQANAAPGADPDTFLYVGAVGGTGSLDVLDSTIDVLSEDGQAFMRVGTFDSAFGELLLSGAGTELTIRGEDAEFIVGRRASGIVNMENSARLNISSSNTSGFAPLRLGFGGASSTGTMNVNSGSIVTVGDGVGGAGQVLVGDSSPDAGENVSGFLNISGAGTEVKAADSVIIGKRNGDGNSTGVVDVSDMGKLSANRVEILEGGTLKGSDGIIEVLDSLVVGELGTLAVGSSPGMMTIDGDLEIDAGGILEFEFAGPDLADQDFLDVLGDVNSGGMFDLILSFLDYEPLVGTEFSFLNATGTIDDSFFADAEISILGLGSDSMFSFVSTDEGIGLRADVVTPVPLPAGIWFLATGLLGLRAIRRRTCASVIN